MVDTVITIWLFGIIPACALAAWINRYVTPHDNALFVCAIWPVLLIYAAFHVAFSGFAPTDTRP
jgi:hypothetical protein